MKTTENIRKWFPVALIGGAFLWSVGRIYFRRAAETEPGVTTIRIGHWQLEASVREALDEMAEEYHKIHPDIRVIQDPIPESTYGQWVTTQLMGRTAPDMIEVGVGLQWVVWQAYLHRYFLPQSDIVGKPNPYNVGTPLEGVALRSTYKDGMRGSYWDQLQEYMTIPLSLFSVRIFYNQELFRKLTGLDAPPREYRAFLEACDKIASQQDEKGRSYSAIAGASSYLGLWEWMMFDPITYPAITKLDLNLDGYVAPDEHYAAFKGGRMSMDHPAYRARYQMFRDVTDRFQKGYVGMGRDEAVFLFAQQRAVFMSTGTWDARGLQEQTKSRFTVGVTEFPLPTKEDPVFGPVIQGPIWERPEGGFPFGITRSSRNPEKAQDFLLFLASQPHNERFNRIIGWIPSCVGTKMDPALEAFEPHLRGVYNVMDFKIGGNATIRYTQDYSLFQVKQLDYDGFKDRFQPFYLNEGFKDFMEVQREWRRGVRNDEVYITGVRSRAMLESEIKAPSFWVKYRNLAGGRQVLPEIGHNRLMALAQGEISPSEPGPYEYSETALANARNRLGVRP